MSDLDPEIDEAALIERLSPELREAVEAAKGRAEAAGWLIPDEADEATIPEPEPVRSSTGVVPVCVYCGAAISSTRSAYRRVVAWERKRRAGGTNAVRLREPLDEYACSTCVDAVAAGRDPGQRAML